MTVLLDSHTLLWALTDESKLPSKVKDVLQNPEIIILVSAVTAWELAVKYHLGKLPQAAEIIKDFYGLIARMGYLTLDVKPHHGLLGASFQHSHRDPFDRLLAAQSQLEKVPLVTADDAVKSLPGLQWFW
ncbi:MAG: type II toxin-antitoxin system VapC family toxin [Trueperaceae bacterium]